jgi:hypothetical protein
MSDNTLKGAADYGLRYPAATTARTGFRSTASTLLNEEGAFDGHVVEAELAHDPEKKSAGGATPAWQGRQSAASITVQPIGPNACV